MGEIKHLMQPERSLLCGQTCLAMLAGKTLDEMIEIYGHGKSTTMKEHVEVAEKLGFKVSNYRRVDNRKKYNLPSISLVRIEKVGKGLGHLVLFYNGKVYDPAESTIFNSKEELIEKYNSYGGKWRVKHYIEIYGKESDAMVAGG